MNRKSTIKHLTSFLTLCVLLVFAAGSMDDTETSSSSEKTPPKVYEIGESFGVGYTAYKVLGSKWAEQLGSGYSTEKPDARFLIVEVIVKNCDKKARSVPPFNLIDESGNEYQTTSKGWSLDNVIDSLDSLNPGVQKQGIIIFDVPRNHTYALKASGGYWSSENAYVKLTP